MSRSVGERAIYEEAVKILGGAGEDNIKLIELRPTFVLGRALPEEHFAKYAESLIGLSKDALCECGCSKECHTKIRGVSGLGRCTSAKHTCEQFKPIGK